MPCSKAKGKEMNDKIKKITDLLNSQRLYVTIQGYGDCEIIDLTEDETGIIIQYEEDLGGYGNHEEVREEITWEELFSKNFKLYTVQVVRTEIEL